MTRRKKKFSELSKRSRVVIRIGAAGQLVVQAAALWDLSRRPADQVRGAKKAWVVASSVNYLGPIAYFVWGRDVRR
ncbi:PLDc N-terminal domain-containing protein [Gordonia sp. DT30]|uniref:PLDc N-terminal domain-containing protein n=1 Tax=Gordonia sp. DT30 TaxID=3416546 RepID=UPI003CF7E178